MTSTQIIILSVALVILAILLFAVVTAGRRQRLRQRFGPEYDRAVAERDSRSEAEKELRERERRHAELTLRSLSEQSRQGYAREWAQVQARFVDAPDEAVRDGDALVTRLVAEIGYPTENYEDQLATLSVEHARTLGHYRDAHDIFLRTERGEASTEQLRQALVHYRALFAELLGAEPVPPEPAGPQPNGAQPPPESRDARRQAPPPPAARRPDSTPQPDGTARPDERSRAGSHPDYS
jgi:hypothetical protein